MPPARSASHSTAPRRQPRRAAPRPRRVALRSSVVRLRWERMGRIALLIVLVAVVGVIAEHALSYVTTRAQDEREQATVRQLERQHRSLEGQARALNDPTTIVRRARQLGMTRAGEQPYAITGQPSH
jgi:cell division protein FtsB